MNNRRSDFLLEAVMVRSALAMIALIAGGVAVVEEGILFHLNFAAPIVQQGMWIGSVFCLFFAVCTALIEFFSGREKSPLWEKIFCICLATGMAMCTQASSRWGVWMSVSQVSRARIYGT
jgi:hypothetical protein